MNYNFKDISEKSLLNCHCKGVHSFVLDEKDGMLTRLYMTTSDHELWLTDINLKDRSPKCISFHPHRRNITIKVIKGTLYNAYINISEYNNGKSKPIKSWKYVSKIDGEGKFEKNSQHFYDDIDIQILKENCVEYLEAKKIHTVWVEKGESVAWLIEEKEEDQNYDNLCYNNANLEEFDWDGLYIKPTIIETKKLLLPYI